jgi:hypothetical protein
VIGHDASRSGMTAEEMLEYAKRYPALWAEHDLNAVLEPHCADCERQSRGEQGFSNGRTPFRRSSALAAEDRGAPQAKGRGEAPPPPIAEAMRSYVSEQMAIAAG